MNHEQFKAFWIQLEPSLKVQWEKITETERDGAGHLPQAVTAREPAPTEMLGPPTLTGRERDVLAW